MGEIRFEHVCKSFGDTKVIDDLNLTIRDGEFTVLVGASGCGKTTLLRMIAGIGPATSGQLYIDGEEISDLPPGMRNIAMVFQNYAIYPTMTVKGNIEFGLVNRKVPKKEREQLIAEVAETVGLTPYLDRKPSKLSGGQRQRVALARAMVKKPSVFLLDEPLSNLDAKLRGAMRSELIELHNRLHTTFVYVTHDQTEAMSMADTIVLMDKGEIQQIGAPMKVYSDPDNIFAARFIGTPPMNVYRKKDFYLGYRPEQVNFGTGDAENCYCTKGEIVTREMLGSETIYKMVLPPMQDGEETVEIMIKNADWSIQTGDTVPIYIPKNALCFFGEDQIRIRPSDERYQYCMQQIG